MEGARCAAKANVERGVRYMTYKTIVVTSDDYLHCLPGFAYLHNQRFGEVPVTILCYKKGRQSLPDNYTKVSIGRQSDFTWSSGMIKYLSENKQDKHVLILLEDYFITDANEHVISMVYDYMLRYPGIAKFDLSGDLFKRGWKPHDRIEGIGEVIRASNKSPYQFSLQAALWRTDFLLEYLDPTENPWQMEKGATARFIAKKNTGEDKRLVLGTPIPIIKYINAVGGEGKKPNEFDKRKFDPVLWSELLRLGYVQERSE
jgi:hypothetical protein